ncbi:hypothetical protein [Streptomyces sp. NPDC001492]
MRGIDSLNAQGYAPLQSPLTFDQEPGLGLAIPPARDRLTHRRLDFVASAVDAAARVGLDVVLSPSGRDHDRSFERLVSKGRVDGVILMEIRVEEARVGRLQEAGPPFVGIGHTAGDRQMSWIDVDDVGLVRHCVRHRDDPGHRRVALISRSPELVAGRPARHPARAGGHRPAGAVRLLPHRSGGQDLGRGLPPAPDSRGY